MALNQSRCDQCGQTDDHPKVHVSDGGSFHHDCVSADLDAALRASNPTAGAVIDAARSGVRGDDLRAHIANLHAAPSED